MRQIEIKLPVFHPGQVRAFEVFRRNKYVAGCCGRRWGKTDLAESVAVTYVAKGRQVGWFAPSHKIMNEAYNDIVFRLGEAVSRSSKVEGVVRTITNGRVDFWSLENEKAGRSRKYHLVIIDEAAFAKDTMATIWDQAIEPTLLDYSTLPYGGKCLVISNANGVSEDNWFYQICEAQRERFGFVKFEAPTSENPYMPKDRLVVLERSKHPLVWQQEYLAKFVDMSGAMFFSKDKLLLDGSPVPFPTHCEQVFAVIDTAVKEGKVHDATAVSYWAKLHAHFDGPYKLVCLDWDVISIDGAILETWIPSVFHHLNHYAKVCGSALGSGGAYIEDAASGSILLQQCALRGYPAEPLPQELTSAGKDARAVNASGPVWCGDVKFSEEAYTKTSEFKGTWRNHMLSQVTSFRVGDKDAAKRSDDLLDTFTYAVAISLGGPEGIA